MKKFILLVLMSLFVIPLAVVAQDNQAFYKEELKKQGWLYGCTPPNWSVVQLRGGFNMAVSQGRTDIMDLEIKAGLDPNTCVIGKTKMTHFAIGYKNTKSLDYLLNYGMDVNETGYTHSLITMAIYYKCPECVQVLLDHKVDVNNNFRDILPLNYAIKKNQTEIVKMLLDAGAKPNDKTKTLVEKSKNQEIKSLFTK